MHRTALDRPGPDQRHFHHEVVEILGSQARQRRHLGPALHLEHADGVGRAQELVDLLLLRDGREIHVDALVLAHEIDRDVQHREHAEAEQIELHQARGRAVVLVPLENRTAFHARPLDRAELEQRAVGHHHPAGVNAEMAREVDHLRRERERQAAGSPAPACSRADRRAEPHHACDPAPNVRTGARSACSSRTGVTSSAARAT